MMARDRGVEVNPYRILREGYRGKPIPPGAKPVKSAAADVPVKSDKDAPSQARKMTANDDQGGGEGPLLPAQRDSAATRTFRMGFKPLIPLDKGLRLAGELEDEELLRRLAARK